MVLLGSAAIAARKREWCVAGGSRALDEGALRTAPGTLVFSDGLRHDGTNMGRRALMLGLVCIGAGATAVLADSPVEHAQVSSGGLLAVVRTVAVLPVKGVGCFVGAVFASPVY